MKGLGGKKQVHCIFYILIWISLGEHLCSKDFLEPGFLGGSAVKNLLAMKEMQEMRALSLRQEDSGGGHGNPLQYSYQENLMAKGAWRAMVHGAAKNQRQFKRLITEQYFLEHKEPRD